MGARDVVAVVALIVGSAVICGVVFPVVVNWASTDDSLAASFRLLWDGFTDALAERRSHGRP